MLHRVALDDSPWRVGDAISVLFLDLAAGWPVAPRAPLLPDQVALAYRHALIGLAANHPHPFLREPTLPVYARLISWQEIMLRQLKRLLHAFASRNIPAAVVKGPYLASRAYQNPQLRTFTDIDLLVRPRDLQAALELLSRDPAVQSIPPRGPKADKRNIPITDPSGRSFSIDLHWDLFSYSQLQGRAVGATEWAWTEADGLSEDDLGPIWELPPAIHLAFLCTHAVLDHRFRLVLFRDLAEMARSGVDWEAVCRFAARWGLRSSTYVALLIAKMIVDAAVPEQVLADLRPSGLALRGAERWLPRTDLVHFDGRRLHALNLAIVLLHDDPGARLRLALRAPFAFPRWRRRTAAST